MLHPRRQSTTTGFTSCGGVELETNNAIYNCETFDPSTGKWEITATFEDARIGHVAWQYKEGIFLMSGRGGAFTSTFIGNDGSASAGWDLKYHASW